MMRAFRPPRSAERPTELPKEGDMPLTTILEAPDQELDDDDWEEDEELGEEELDLDEYEDYEEDDDEGEL
jgi:hypothetical protein